MINIAELRILFVQRVITNYRLNLLKVLCDDFKEVGIITSKGNKEGTLKLASFQQTLLTQKNLNIYELPSIRIGYKGESRSTSLFLYPKAISKLNHYDIIVFEGTTNLLNNLYLLPIAKLLRKKTIWWDAGYSLPNRSFKRKLIDNVVKLLVKLTNKQMAYSTLAKNYLYNHMGAKNVFLNLNTINTSYFESIADEIRTSIENYKFNPDTIKLLYVGVVEERKKVKELIEIVIRLNKQNKKRVFVLTIIGGGAQVNELIEYTANNENINLLGAIYDKEQLKKHYFKSDLFVLPGDGGLAILQSLLFGLPVLSIIGADGTELDYIKDKSYLAKSIIDIEEFLTNLSDIKRRKIIKNLPQIQHKYWVKTLIENLKEL